MNNFTPRAQQALNIARREADRFHHNYIGAEHLLLGLLKLGDGVAVSVMERNGINVQELATRIEQSLVPGNASTEGTLPFTPRVRKILTMAGGEARALRHTYVGTEHILLAMLRDEDGLAWHALTSSGLTYENTRQGVLETIAPGFESNNNSRNQPEDEGGMNFRPNDDEEDEDQPFMQSQSANSGNGGGRSRGSALQAFGRDLTERARKGELDPVIGTSPK